jgi:hypothetical protein
MSDKPSEGPWYKDGLCFSCTQCGNCCTGFEGVVWVTDAEIQAIADFLGQPFDEVKQAHTRKVGNRISLREFRNGDCTFFDGQSRRCQIYPVRPPQCRTWPFWNSNLESPEAWREIQPNCPGVGHGNLYSIEQIREQAAVINL